MRSRRDGAIPRGGVAVTGRALRGALSRTVGVAESAPVAVARSVADAATEKHVVAESDAARVADAVADGQRETEPESDATVADAVSVDPAGAQSGPMLNVARCVPPSEARGDADAADGDGEAVAKTVTTDCVTERVSVAVASAVTTV